jgi:hypothetical protein
MHSFAFLLLFLCPLGGRRQTSSFCPPSGSPVFTCPEKTSFLVALNFLGLYIYLFLKLSPVMKSNVKALEQSVKTSAIHGSLSFLDLK